MLDDKFEEWWKGYGPEYLRDLDPRVLARIAFKCGYLLREQEGKTDGEQSD